MKIRLRRSNRMRMPVRLSQTRCAYATEINLHNNHNGKVKIEKQLLDGYIRGRSRWTATAFRDNGHHGRLLPVGRTPSRVPPARWFSADDGHPRNQEQPFPSVGAVYTVTDSK